MRLGVALDDVIYASGASRKVEALESHEQEHGEKPGSVPSLFVEDSFDNLVSVLNEREDITGLHYKGRTANDEDRWGYGRYITHAEEAYAAGKTGHAFEYYYNAVVKILELKGLTRQDAYAALETIYQKLRLMKDARRAGYDRLFQIVEIAKEGRSYLFHDAEGRALRPAVAGGPARARPDEYWQAWLG